MVSSVGSSGMPPAITQLGAKPVQKQSMEQLQALDTGGVSTPPKDQKQEKEDDGGDMGDSNPMQKFMTAMGNDNKRHIEAMRKAQQDTVKNKQEQQSEQQAQQRQGTQPQQ